MFNLWLLLTVLLTLARADAGVRWGIYRWINDGSSLFEPLSKSKIQLSHPSYPHLSISFSTPSHIKQQFNAYNHSQYTIQETGKLTLSTSNTLLVVEIRNVKNFNITTICRTHSCQPYSRAIIEQLLAQKQSGKYCKQDQSSFSCTVQNSTLVLTIDPRTENQQNTGLKLQYEKFHQENLLNFMTIYEIDIEPQKILIVQHSLSSLINSICLYKGQGQDYFSLGFCDFNGKSKRWSYNFKLAAFSLYLLADYHLALAENVYKDYFSLLETRLLYPLKQESEVLPFPEHIEVLTRFGSVLELQSQAELLNSFFVIPMLNQLGTLHEELNYREAKKIHPLLLKMLQQKWSASSSKESLKSIYQQSFTEDFKYHSYGERLDQSVAKNSWIFKVIDTYTGLLIKHHAFYMPVQQIKEHLQEHFTLLNLIKVYANDDKEAKNGKYRDVVDVGQDLKLYGRYNGYEAILPFVYGLGKVYPEATIKELESSIGLKSSTQEPEEHDKKYRFRGDIHTYFNFKIITGSIQRIQQDKSLPQTRRNQILIHLNKIAASVGRKVMKDFKEQGEVYTSWTVEGKGRQRNGWGQIVSALFLKWV